MVVLASSAVWTRLRVYCLREDAITGEDANEAALTFLSN